MIESAEECFLKLSHKLVVQKIPALKPGETMVWYIDVGSIPHRLVYTYIEKIKNMLVPGIIAKGEDPHNHIFAAMREYNIGAKLVVIDEDTRLKEFNK